MTFVDDKVVITGVGQSAVGRKLFRSGIDLAIDAALAQTLRVPTHAGKVNATDTTFLSSHGTCAPAPRP